MRVCAVWNIFSKNMTIEDVIITAIPKSYSSNKKINFLLLYIIRATYYYTLYLIVCTGGIFIYISRLACPYRGLYMPGEHCVY